MSVLNPVIDHLDTAAKLIYLAVGVREYHPINDIYAEVRNLRRTNDALRWFKVPVTAAGNVGKGGGKFTPRYAIFRWGWRVVPEDTSHVLFVSGEQITDDNQAGPACFDLTPLSATSKVIIQYEPPAAEVIVVDGSGSGTAPTAEEVADAVWADPSVPRAPTPAEVADAVLDEAAAAHVAAGSVGELLLGLAQLVAQQAAQIQTLQRERGLDPAVETKYGIEGSTGYIRSPADGSLLNIQISTTGSGSTKVVTKRRL